MKEIFRKSKKGGLMGASFKRLFKVKAFAMLMLLFVGVLYAGSSVESGDTVTQFASVGLTVSMAIGAFVVPKDLGLKEEDAKGLEALAKHLGDQLDKGLDGLISKEEMSDSIKKALEDYAKEYGVNKETLDKLEKALKTQGLEINTLKTGGSGSVGDSQIELKEFIKENAKAIKDLPKLGSKEIELKAVAPITTANASSAPNSFRIEVDRSVHEAPREDTVFFPSLLKGSTDSATIIWVNRKGKEGGAAFIAEGVLKPLMDWVYEQETSTAKKVAVRAKFTEEMLDDHLFIKDEIDTLMRINLMEEVDAKILTGSTATEPKGIITNAGGYVGTTLDGTVPSANNADAIRAGILQQRLINHKPDFLFINPAEKAALDLLKSNTGNYIKVEVAGILSQVRIIETTAIPAGYFLLMDSRKWVLKVYKGIRLEFWRSEDDFDKNMVTAICEMRLHSYQSSVDAGSVLYDSFATVKAALEKL